MSEATKISVKREREDEESEPKRAKGPSITDRLLNKRRATTEVTIDLDGEPVTLRFEAVSSHEMDALISRNPPTKEQRGRGMTYNPNTLNPELVSMCSVEPRLTKEETRDMWQSENWSAGELNQISDTVLSLCSEGFGSSFTKSD